MRLNRVLSIVLAIILSAGLIPCALSAAVSAEGSVIDVTSAEQLKAALNRTEKVAQINVKTSFTVNDDCMIYYDGAHLQYYSDTVVMIEEGVTLTVGEGGVLGSFWPSFEGDWDSEPQPNGKLINNGVVIIGNGGAIEADFNTNNGSVTVKSGGFCVCPRVNNGDVTVEYRGRYFTSQGMEVHNYGTVDVRDGSLMCSRFGSTIINEKSGVITLDGDFQCGCMGNTGDVMLFENHGTVEGEGSVYLYESDRDIAPVSDMDGLIERMMEMLGQTSRFENWDDISICKILQAYSFEELKEATTGERVVAGEHVEGDMDSLITVNADITIPEGTETATMARIYIPEGVTVTVSGGASLEAGIKNSGTVKVLSHGELLTTMGGAIDNNGLLFVEAGALLKSQKGSCVNNLEDGKLELSGNFYCGSLNIGEGDFYWFNNYGDISGIGNFVLYEAAHDDFPVEDMDGLIEDVMEMLGMTSRFDSWGHINVFKKLDVSSLEEIIALIPGDRIVAGEAVEGDRDTLFEITGDITVPADAMIITLASISVPKGLKLTVSGILQCGLYNDGEVEIEDGGQFYAAAYSPLQNCSVIHVSEFASFSTVMGSDIINYEEAKIILDGVMMLGCLGREDGDDFCFINEGEVSGKGKIIMAETDPVNYPVSDLDGLIEDVMEEIGQTSRFDDWDDINIYKYVAASSFGELASYFPGDRVVAGEHVEGDSDVYVAIIQDITVPEGCSIRTMGTIVIPEDVKLTVEDGGALECNIDNDGTVEVLSGGELSTTMGGKIRNYTGILTIAEGATLTSQMGSSVVNCKDGSMTIDGTFNCGCLNYGEGDVIWFENEGDVDGKGEIVLCEIDGMSVDDMDAVIDRVYELIGETDITVRAENKFTPGDINGDGSVNNKDVVALFKYVSGTTENVNVRALDTNGDGFVNNKDVVQLFKHVSGGADLSDKPYYPPQK